MRKYLVWWTYIGNWGEPELVEAENEEQAIEAYPTWYQKAVMEWFVVEVKARSHIFKQAARAEAVKAVAEVA